MSTRNRSVKLPPMTVARLALDWRALVLAATGLTLTFAAPPHRLDLLLLGLAACASGLVWSPAGGPVLIGAALPFFFFSRQLFGPLGVTPPGLVLVLTWLAVLARARHLRLRWPASPYDRPLALF